MTEPSEYPTPRPGIVVTDLKDLLRVNNFDLAWEFALIEDKLHTAAKDAEYWKAQTEQARSRSVEATNAKDALFHKFNQHKELVREIAIEVHQEHPGELCRDGLNEILERLDLPIYEPRRYVEVKVTFLVEGDSAGDDDDAEQAVGSALENLYASDITVEETDFRRTWATGE